MDSAIHFLQQLYHHPLFWHLFIPFTLTLLYIAYYIKFRSPSFLIKGKYDIKKKSLRNPPPPYPNGWYNIAKAQEIKKGQAKNIEINGHNLVVFRGTNNIVYALDAYCLHMGANLGVGGQVINEKCIKCPFHGWLYDGTTGHCVDHNGKPLQLSSIEYNSDLCKKDGKLQWTQGKTQNPTLRKYPISELNGYIYVWIHALEQYFQKPQYPMLDVSSFLNTLTYRGQTEHHINCHPQDIPSNGADVLHFKYVHTYVIPWITSVYFRWDAKWTTADDPDIKAFFEHSKKDIRSFKQRVWKELIEPYPNKEFLSIGNLQNWIRLPIFGQWYMFSATIIQVGLCIVFVVLKSPLYELVFHHYVRPQGRNFQVVFHDGYVSNHLPYFATSKMIEMQGGQVTNDMYIWESKSFAKKSCLNEERESDIIMRDWLKWSGKFYHGCSYQQQKQKYTW